MQISEAFIHTLLDLLILIIHILLSRGANYSDCYQFISLRTYQHSLIFLSSLILEKKAN